MAKSKEHPTLEFRSPRSYSMGRPVKPRVIVIHTTEGHEHNRAAEDGAAYDGRRRDGTSAHYFVDPDSAVQCVLTTDRAHTARSNGNRIGIHYELCGRAGQTPAQWDDAASNAIIRRAARIAAQDAARYGIPIRRLTASQVRAGMAGFCGHADITHAFPEDNGSHTDPGKHFPWGEFLDAVVMAGGSGGKPKPAPAPKPPTYPGREIRRGQRSGTVKQVQARLAAIGFQLAADGDFGPATERTVKAFQSARKLSADGIVGPRTWRALFG